MPDTAPPTADDEGSSTLADGCRHTLYSLDARGGFFDFHCTGCNGILHAPWASKWAGHGWERLGERVAETVDGTYHGNSWYDPRQPSLPALPTPSPDSWPPYCLGGEPASEPAPATATAPVDEDAPIIPGDTVYPAEGGPFEAFGAHRVIWRLEQEEHRWLWLVPEANREAGPRTMSAQFWTRTPPTEAQSARREALCAELAAEHERLTATGCDSSGRPLPRRFNYQSC